jgi:anthranilate phosphoribosyltransferase
MHWECLERLDKIQGNKMVVAQAALRDIVLVNSAAGIIVGGKTEDFGYGIELARESIVSGAAYKKLRVLVKASHGSLEKIEELELKYA